MSTTALAYQSLILAHQRCPKQDDSNTTTLDLSLSKMEKSDERDVKAFYKDWDRYSKVLTFDDQTIYSKYQTVLDAINDLGEQQQTIIHLQREIEKTEAPDADLLVCLQTQYDQMEDDLELKTDLLKGLVKDDFEGYLADHLGPKRMHLIPEIMWRFSQKALTTFYGQFDLESMRKYKGLLNNSRDKRNSIVLHIPEDPMQPVQITAKSKVFYDRFLPGGKADQAQEIAPVQLRGQAIYTIGLNGKTTAKVEFTLTQSKLAAKAQL